VATPADTQAASLAVIKEADSEDREEEADSEEVQGSAED
jgi:hypothetical protein